MNRQMEASDFFKAFITKRESLKTKLKFSSLPVLQFRSILFFALDVSHIELFCCMKFVKFMLRKFFFEVLDTLNICVQPLNN